MSEVEEIEQLVDTVLAAYARGDEETVEDNSSAILINYLEAMRDIHFEESHLQWLNEIIEAIDGDTPEKLIAILEKEQDPDYVFLGSQVAVLIAGYRHLDGLVTIAQAVGIRALLRNS
ncbi:MAG: hypothetical protein EHM86_03795 [Desulfobulbaceae bacterium]|nr:MAG: hypothetical protein EHM86_03795 [Desulfobulbaceae bacterium]